MGAYSTLQSVHRLEILITVSPRLELLPEAAKY